MKYHSNEIEPNILDQIELCQQAHTRNYLGHQQTGEQRKLQRLFSRLLFLGALFAFTEALQKTFPKLHLYSTHNETSEEHFSQA